MERLRHVLSDFLYPPKVACWLCGQEGRVGEDFLCPECHAGLHPCPVPACAQPLDGLRAGLIYDDEASELVHLLKYKNQPHIARVLAAYMEIPQQWRSCVIVPVPLHPLKLCLRGYNQSLLLAEELRFRYPELALRPRLLSRVRFTRAQARLRRSQRQVNPGNAFRANGGAAGLQVLLVDDVVTTKATLSACAKALKQAGAARVYAVCACCSEYPSN